MEVRSSLGDRATADVGGRSQLLGRRQWGAITALLVVATGISGCSLRGDAGGGAGAARSPGTEMDERDWPDGSSSAVEQSSNPRGTSSESPCAEACQHDQMSGAHPEPEVAWPPGEGPGRPPDLFRASARPRPDASTAELAGGAYTYRATGDASTRLDDDVRAFSVPQEFSLGAEGVSDGAGGREFALAGSNRDGQVFSFTWAFDEAERRRLREFSVTLPLHDGAPGLATYSCAPPSLDWFALGTQRGASRGGDDVVLEHPMAGLWRLECVAIEPGRSTRRLAVTMKAEVKPAQPGLPNQWDAWHITAALDLEDGRAWHLDVQGKPR